MWTENKRGEGKRGINDGRTLVREEEMKERRVTIIAHTLTAFWILC